MKEHKIIEEERTYKFHNPRQGYLSYSVCAEQKAYIAMLYKIAI
jgi:hypothetical protein